MTVNIDDMNIVNDRSLDSNNTFSDFEKVFDSSAFNLHVWGSELWGLSLLIDFM